jgi:hypothetical protein
MSSRPFSDDEVLLAHLGDSIRAADPVPASVIAAAEGTFTWLNIDEELATLSFDSHESLAGARSAGGARQLTFESEQLEMELLVEDSVVGQLIGQLIPADQGASTRRNAPHHRVDPPKNEPILLAKRNQRISHSTVVLTSDDR